MITVFLKSTVRALGVGQAAVLEDLQQRVEDVGMGLLDLVEQHDRVGTAADGLGELAALLVAHVTRRRPDETGNRVLLHVLGHVELDERVLVAEEELGEGLGRLGLTDPGWSEEDERAGGTLGVLQPGARPADRARHRGDRVVLADDAFVELVFHAKQLGRLFFGKRSHRDARPGRQDLGDLLLIDLGERLTFFGAPFGLFARALLHQGLLFVAEARSLLEVLSFDRAFLVGTHRGDLLFELAVVRRRAHPADAQARAGLVDQVDRLVGQVAVGDVAVCKVRRRDQAAVGDVHAVVCLVAVAQSFEDVDRVGDRRLGNLDRLEPALEGRVLLEVLAVLVERRRADRLQLASCQHRLQDRSRVDRAFGRTRSDERVELVDEQDDVAARLDLLEHLLEALFEVAAVARPGDQCAEVERVELLAGDRLRHLAAHDLLRESLDDRGLADAGLADEYGVVLGAPRQHLHDALDLVLPPDDGIELVLARELRQVATELVEDERTLWGLASAPGGRGLSLVRSIQTGVG